jgi:hypothetical protein
MRAGHGNSDRQLFASPQLKFFFNRLQTPEESASGSTFPLGTTLVSVSATDAAGNTDTGSFTVTVLDAEDPLE